MKNSFNINLERGADSVLTASGVFPSPARGRKYAGVSKNGSNVYVSIDLAGSNDIKAGFAYVHTLAAFVTPFGVLTKREGQQVLHLAAISGEPKLIATLDRLQDERKPDSFVATILKAVKSDTRHALGVLASIKVYDHWGVISPAQKSIAIAVLGVQTHRTDKRGPVCDLNIIEGPKGQIFKVRDAIEFFSMGKNPFLLVRYWDQIRLLHGVYGGDPTPQALSDFAESHKLLGMGLTGGAVPGVSKRLIGQSQGKAVPQYGVGALAVPSSDKGLPQGYAKATQMAGHDIIVPQPNAQSAIGAMQNSLLGTQAGTQGMSSDSVSTYKKWKPNSSKVTDKGAEGGSHFVAALTDLRLSSPHLYNALVAFLGRDVFRDVKSSNALEYASSLAGIALSHLVTGKKEAKFQKEGLAVTLDAHAANQENFSKLQIALRGTYAVYGVSSKADAFQLSNQAFAEERVDESDLVAMHEIFSVIYDEDGFARALRLMSGKEKAFQVMANPPPDAKNSMFGTGMTLKYVDQMIAEEEKDKKAKALFGSSDIGEPEEEEPGENPEEEASETPEQENQEESSEPEGQAQGEPPEEGALPDTGPQQEGTLSGV